MTIVLNPFTQGLVQLLNVFLMNLSERVENSSLFIVIGQKRTLFLTGSGDFLTASLLSASPIITSSDSVFYTRPPIEL